jgi:sulfatase modifying factor 1
MRSDRVQVACLVLSVVALAAGCGDDTSSPPVANQPPVAAISSPASGSVFAEGDTVRFEGSGNDPEDGVLAGSSLVWSSNLDGAIGTGTSVSADDLSPGAHLISLAATDSQGAADTATVAIEITAGPVIVELAWVALPGGEYTMGSPEAEPGRDADEGPEHLVTLPAFEITTTEVTATHYARWLNDELAGGHVEVGAAIVTSTVAGRFPGEPYLELGPSGIEFGGGSFAVTTGKENLPVIRVTWYGAEAFCESFGWRLPTEAEWEYACQAGTASALYNGAFSGNECDFDATLDEIAWYCGNAGGSVHEVRQKTPNAFGLFDRSGGAGEWCSDWYGTGYYLESPRDDPPGPDTGFLKVVRGGAWETHARFCRSASRHRVAPDYLQSTTYGFRPAR